MAKLVLDYVAMEGIKLVTFLKDRFNHTNLVCLGISFAKGQE